MKILKTFTLLFAIFLASNMYAQTVTLDPTFGENGMVVIPTTNISQFEFLDFDKLGNIIAVGRNGSCLLIAKTNADGIMDQNFGVDGIVTLCDYAYSVTYGLKITHENKIFIISLFSDGGYKVIFTQLNEDGSLDQSFGEQGFIVNPISSIRYYPNLESDDFMLVGSGTTISKYSYSGKIDESFGVNGKVNLTDNETYKIIPVRIKILSDQFIFIVGYDELNPREIELAFCKISLTGDLITDFANNGIWKKNIFNDFDLAFEYFLDIVEDSHENLILLGGFNEGSTSYVCSFYSNGTINGNFGKDGFYYIPYSLHYRGAQKILQNGSNYTISLFDRIISVKNNGTLDTDFNNTGLFICENNFRDMKYQRPDKLILVGGSNQNLRITRLNVPSDISVKEAHYTKNSINIFPNPTTDYLYFSNEAKFEIMDMFGKKVLISERAISSVNISHLRAGIYFIKFEDNQVRKFAK